MAVGVLCAVLSWQGKTWQWMKENWTLDHMHRCQNHWVWALTKPSVSSKVLTYSRVLCRSWRGFSDGVNFIYSFYNYFFFTQTWIPFSIFSLCLFMGGKKNHINCFPLKKHLPSKSLWRVPRGRSHRKASPCVASDSWQAPSQQQHWHLPTWTLHSWKCNKRQLPSIPQVILLKTQMTKAWEKWEWMSCAG